MQTLYNIAVAYLNTASQLLVLLVSKEKSLMLPLKNLVRNALGLHCCMLSNLVDMA